MKIDNTKYDKLKQGKKFAKNDTSYTSFWLYNKDADILSEDFKDKVVLEDKNIFSEFNPSIAKNVISYWSNEGDIILDPFAGRTRGFIASIMKRGYIGFEIVKSTFDYLCEKNTIKDFPPIFINDDCKNIDNYEDIISEESADLIFTCPPYWNIERYESYGGQLSDFNNYPEFLEELVRRLNIFSKYLKKGGFMVLVVGDFRKEKKYIPFHSDLIQEFKRIEHLKLHEIIAVQNIPFHTGAFYFGSRKKNKQVSKIHEYILIFSKL